MIVTGCSLDQRSVNSPVTMQNSPAKFFLFPERAFLFHNNSSVEYDVFLLVTQAYFYNLFLMKTMFSKEIRRSKIEVSITYFSTK